jgi:N-sulfoglucosamine sulfohydrolase
MRAREHSWCPILILVALVLGSLGAVRSAADAAPPERWNLLLITADDLNGDSMGWMGCTFGATPALDQFARTCHQLHQCHVTVPICQPSRSAFMTGRVPHRNGALGFHPIRRDVPTLPESLSAKGYFTCAINKIEHMQPREKFNWDLPLNGSGKNPKAIAEHVAQALRTATERKQPFFINANITDPHRPFYGSEQGRQARRPGARGEEGTIKPYAEAEVKVPSFLEDLPPVRKEVAEYYSSVRRMDQSFQGILVALKNSGKADSTVVVFMADHGMSFPFSKATVYRNGTWAPVLIRWPGMGSPVALREEMVSSVDLMPSLLELLRIEAPGGMDGRSFLPLLRGEKQPGRDFVITHVNSVSSGKSFPGRCVRSRTRAYMFNSWPDGTTRFRVEAMNGLSWNAIAAAGEADPRIGERARQFLLRSTEEYYDLEKDPDERRNLIREPAYREEIEAARKRLLAHMEKTEDPLLDQFRKTAQL